MHLLQTTYKTVRAVFRLLFFVVIIIVFFSTGIYIYFTNKTDLNARRKKLIENGTRYCRFILKTFNVKLICKNPIPADEASLLVGNHMGFIDIVCILSLQPVVFITSRELRETPFLGQITEMGACAYVDRRSRMKIQEELMDIINVLKQGFRVVLFAEATSSNGEQVLPFKKTLMMSSGFSHRPIRPFCFNFRKVNDGPVLYEHRDSLCWYGDIGFFTSVWKSMNLDSIEAEIEFLPLVTVPVDADRTEISNKIHSFVQQKFNPFKADMNSI